MRQKILVNISHQISVTTVTCRKLSGIVVKLIIISDISRQINFTMTKQKTSESVINNGTNRYL
jgi:hypothetical protein